ncbi:DUF6527 family protein [Pseudoduganella lurida]|uniref:DUF6527 family protein n=1 Tax=Pseudoduganella lurida TaxID=1036180 RepID=UPI0011AA0601|nr:DUF6527 family protein [Pseudoduganella lurida]
MIKLWWRRLKSYCENRYYTRRIEICNSEILPVKMPTRNIVLLREGNQDWSVGFACPCGCFRTIELLLIPDATPHWVLTINKERPTLSPSVWLKTGCRSHFWVRDGKIIWCKS